MFAVALAAPAVAQVLLPPASIPNNRGFIDPRNDPNFEPGLLQEPDAAPQPPPVQPARPQLPPRGGTFERQAVPGAPTAPMAPAMPLPRGSFDQPVERQALPPLPGNAPQAAPGQPAAPGGLTPPGQAPGQQRQQAARPAPPGPGIQTQQPPSPGGAVPPGTEDFVVVAPPTQRIENKTAIFNGLDKISAASSCSTWRSTKRCSSARCR